MAAPTSDKFYTEAFANVTATVATAAFDCSPFSRVSVTIAVTEVSGTATITPEIQFNENPRAGGSWTTGAVNQYWGPAATATAMNFTMAAISATGIAVANTPVMSGAVRVNLVVAGTGEYDPVTVTIMGIE